MRFIHVQVTDEAASKIADELQAADLHAQACCIQVLLRDRDELRQRLKLACEPCAECGHCDWRELDDILENPTERVEAATTPEGAKGWVDQAGSAHNLAGGHGLDVAPDASSEGVRAETRREEDGAGGEPSNAPKADPRADVLAALTDGPKSNDELGIDTGFLKAMAADGLVTIDPDRWPDELVPGNPFIARLPGDDRRWPGWDRWNV